MDDDKLSQIQLFQVEFVKTSLRSVNGLAFERAVLAAIYEVRDERHLVALAEDDARDRSAPVEPYWVAEKPFNID